MGAKKKSWYAVKRGRRPGLYTDWEDCRKEILGFGGAEYKGFYTKEEAERYLAGDAETAALREPASEEALIAYVDGSYAPFLPDRYAFGAVFLYQGKVIRMGKKLVDPVNAQMRNVAGEVAGARYAMEYCVAEKIPSLALYYDYAGIEKWCSGEWKANKDGTKALKAYYDSIRDVLHVSFYKVKSHTGVTYNEMADRLAKAALFESEP